MTISMLLKWTVLIWLNAAASFYIALPSHPGILDTAGICFAVFTFVGIYAYIDLFLLEEGETELRAQLFWGVLLKSLTQVTLVAEALTGSMALSFVKEFMMIDMVFVTPYLVTIVDGILLTVLTLLMMIPTVRIARQFLKKSSCNSHKPC